jgi:hypothetical protein
MLIPMERSRKRPAWHVALMVEKMSASRILLGRREGTNHVEEGGVDSRIILKLILKEWYRVCTRFACLPACQKWWISFV